MEKVTVVLGTGQLMPAAEDAVYGHCAGETFRFDFTYPADFRVPELSGRTAQFEICLHTVERKQVPPVDDALAKSLGYADLEALRESLREKNAFPRGQRRPHCRGGAAGYGGGEPDRGAARRAAGAERRIPDDPAAPAAAQEQNDHGALLQERRADPGAGAEGYRRKPSASCGPCWRCAPSPKPKRSP